MLIVWLNVTNVKTRPSCSGFANGSLSSCSSIGEQDGGVSLPGSTDSILDSASVVAELYTGSHEELSSATQGPVGGKQPWTAESLKKKNQKKILHHSYTAFPKGNYV